MNMFEKIKLKHLLMVLVLIFLGAYFNFFLNTHLIFKNDFKKRMILSHGYCEKEGYGFVEYTLNKYKLNQNIRVINSQSNNYPDIWGYFYKNNQKFIKEYLILINFNEEQLSAYLNNFKIKEKKNNCYLLQIND